MISVLKIRNDSPYAFEMNFSDIKVINKDILSIK